LQLSNGGKATRFYSLDKTRGYYVVADAVNDGQWSVMFTQSQKLGLLEQKISKSQSAEGASTNNKRLINRPVVA
jgi:hypothetical protein